MLLVRGTYFSTQEVVAGQWPKAQLDRGREIMGLTLGVVGFGSIGRTTAALAQRLGMRVVAADSGAATATHGDVEMMPLAELLGLSDVVTLHLPLTEQSAGLFDARTIASLKPGAVLINAARGGIVDDGALVEALRRGHLGGAAIDAFQNEPLGPSPMYADTPNLILTPHIAGVTQDSERRVNQVVVDKVLAVLCR